MIVYTELLKLMKSNDISVWALHNYLPGKATAKVLEFRDKDNTTEEGIAKLNEVVNMYPAGHRFFLEYWTAINSPKDQSYRIDFYKAPENPAQNMAGFSGLGQINMDGLGNMYDRYYSQVREEDRSYQDKLFDLMRRENDLAIRQDRLARKEEDFEERKKNTIAEMEELRKKFESNAAAGKHAFDLFVGEALTRFKETGSLRGLLGGTAEAVEETEEELTPEQNKIRELAEEIDRQGLTINQLEALHQYTLMGIEQIKQHSMREEGGDHE